jgi:hypothetical protein
MVSKVPMTWLIGMLLRALRMLMLKPPTFTGSAWPRCEKRPPPTAKRLCSTGGWGTDVVVAVAVT